MTLWPPHVRSLREPLHARGGTYTTEGITALCEGLKGSAVTSVK